MVSDRAEDLKRQNLAKDIDAVLHSLLDAFDCPQDEREIVVPAAREEIIKRTVRAIMDQSSSNG